MEKFYVAEVMRITKWYSGDVGVCSRAEGFDNIDLAKKWIALTVLSDMNGIYGRDMHLLDGAIDNIDNAETGKWYPYAHSNKDAHKHARYTYSITERCI